MLSIASLCPIWPSSLFSYGWPQISTGHPVASPSSQRSPHPSSPNVANSAPYGFLFALVVPSVSLHRLPRHAMDSRTSEDPRIPLLTYGAILRHLLVISVIKSFVFPLLFHIFPLHFIMFSLVFTFFFHPSLHPFTPHSSHSSHLTSSALCFVPSPHFLPSVPLSRALFLFPFFAWPLFSYSRRR